VNIWTPQCSCVGIGIPPAKLVKYENPFFPSRMRLDNHLLEFTNHMLDSNGSRGSTGHKVKKVSRLMQMSKKILHFLIPLIIGGLLTSAYLSFESYILQSIHISVVSNKPSYILRILLSIPTSAALVLAYFLLHNRSKNKRADIHLQLLPKFGIYWDKDKQAYCPSCKTLLSDYRPFVHASGKTSYLYHCIKCDKMIPLTDGEHPITLNDALKKL